MTDYDDYCKEIDRLQSLLAERKQLLSEARQALKEVQKANQELFEGALEAKRALLGVRIYSAPDGACWCSIDRPLGVAGHSDACLRAREIVGA